MPPRFWGNLIECSSKGVQIGVHVRSPKVRRWAKQRRFWTPFTTNPSSHTGNTPWNQPSRIGNGNWATTCSRASKTHSAALFHTDRLTVHPLAISVTVSYTHLRAHETGRNLVCRLLL